MYVCMYICAHVYIYTCGSVRAYIDIYIYAFDEASFVELGASDEMRIGQ